MFKGILDAGIRVTLFGVRPHKCGRCGAMRPSVGKRRTDDRGGSHGKGQHDGSGVPARRCQQEDLRPTRLSDAAGSTPAVIDLARDPAPCVEAVRDWRQWRKQP